MAMKESLLRLFVDTLEEVALDRVMAGSVRRSGPSLVVDGREFDVAGARRIYIAGIGKAAWPMCRALMPLLPDQTTATVVAPTATDEQQPRVSSFVGGHPYPTVDSEAAAREILRRAGELGPEDLFICLLSGGGSAICEAPLDVGLSLEDILGTFEVLVTCGANIVEMNIVRKHLSLIKGGRLAQAAAPARQLTLYVSDVPPGEPSSVASGPTMPDESTCEDAYRVAADLGITARLPGPVRRLIEQRTLVETPSPGDEAFVRSDWICLSDNFTALDCLERRTRSLGWKVKRDTSVDDWPVERAADVLLDRLCAAAEAHPGQTVAVTVGGELSSPVTGDGRGGRNQAFVLWAARKIAERGIRATVLSAGTDGIDGNSPAAGAIADAATLRRAASMGMDADDYDRRSDSYAFFENLGDLILTGPTGNNVRDLRMLVAQPD